MSAKLDTLAKPDQWVWEAMPERPVIVVGAGMGGLAAALLLAARGVSVLVLERGEGPGGKLRPAIVGGNKIDAGPTVFTMRWVFDEILAAAGEDADRLLDLTPLSILARHAWDEGAALDLHASTNDSADAIGAFAGAREARSYLRFMERARQTYATLKDSFLTAPQGGLFGLMRRANPAGLLRISPFQSFWDLLEKQFEDPRLKQLFGRYATYCGCSPFQAPATLMLIAHVEQDGVWSVAGGMSALAEALAAVAQKKGAAFRYAAHVARIDTRNGRASGVVLADGETIEADAVVFNGDAAALAGGLLGNPARDAAARIAPSERSLSALTWAINARTKGRALSRHNVFFSADYRAEFENILRHRRIADDPTVYVCAQDRMDGDAQATPRSERLLCLVNAPADGDSKPMTAPEIEKATAAMALRLKRCGVELEFDPQSCEVRTPSGFDRLYPGTGGALYGRALQGWKTTFQREGAETPVEGLYLAGGSVHPGPGVPMAALSGRFAAEAVIAGLTSTRRSRAAAIAGGTLTR